MTRDGQMRPAWTTAIVVLGTLAMVGVFVYSLGDRTDPAAQDAALPTAASPSAAPDGSPTETPAEAPTEAPRESPAASDPPSDAADQPTSPSPSPPAPTVRAPVGVLNQTTVAGLAARTAAAVEDNGWDVVTVGDATLGVPATTLYVPIGLEEAGESFVAAFPSVVRTRPAFPGLPADQLTLVLALPDAEAVVAALEQAPTVVASGVG